MIESQGSLLPFLGRSSTTASKHKKGKPRVISIGFDELSLEELDRLLDTLEVDVAEKICFPLRTVNPATYIGSGKIEELKTRYHALGGAEEISAIIVDIELTPNQLKNLEKAFQTAVLDRAGVIIEIFSMHAKSREAKTQVELARVQYLLPRLTHFWSHFERQRGGGVGNKGMGEKQLEVDRRLLKNRVTALKKRLTEIEKERNVQRQGRQDVHKVALVGYTNAGKSTLLNSLTESKVLAEDKLFATLDASIRALTPDSRPPIVMIDTVGFISRIPPTLIASFRSTLEELHEADLMIHVVDGSSPEAREQYEVTEFVLKELGLEEKPRFVVVNKMDRVVEGGATRVNWAKLAAPGSILMSALQKDQVRALREKIIESFRTNMQTYEVVVPYSDSKLEALVHANGTVEVKRYLDKGVFLKFRMDPGVAQKIEIEKYKT